MDTVSMNKPPTWFWVVSGLALLWNLFGVMIYLAQVMMSPEMMASRMTAEQIAAVQAQPAWYVGAFAIAVFAGALGSLFLLLRRKWAFGAFALSLLGVLAQQAYHFVLSDTAAAFTGTDYLMVVLIVGIALVMLWFANHATRQGWLR